MFYCYSVLVPDNNGIGDLIGGLGSGDGLVLNNNPMYEIAVVNTIQETTTRDIGYIVISFLLSDVARNTSDIMSQHQFASV